MSDAPPRRLLGPWLIAFVLCTGGVFASLTTIHGAQSRLAVEDAWLINAFRQAIDDLDLGILHMAFASEQDSPWQQAQGAALIEQGARELAEVAGSLDLGESVVALQQDIERLRAALHAERSSALINDPRLRTVIHAAHTQTRAIELALNARTTARERRLDDAFAWTLGVSLLLLTVLATGFVRSELAAQRASDAFVREIADHQDSLVAYYDDTLTLRFANQAFLDWTGLRREDALDRSMAEVLGAERAASRRDSALRVLAGEVIVEQQAAFTSHAGITGQFRVHRRPDIREGKVCGYYLTASNVTELVAARDRLEQMNRALTAERDRAESATRAKSAFLANMSHEIRTPMNAIVGLTSLMQRHAVPPEFRDHLDKVAQSAQHLLRLINDILDLSKIEAGELHLEQLPFDPQAMVRRTVDLIAPAARDRGLALDVSLPVLPAALLGDPTRLSQALLNLLGNAVKFTERGSVQLVVTSTPGVDDAVELRFEVRDSGIGVDDATLARLFRPFQQADAGTTRRYGGTGLGLAITREIARRMGGEAGGSGQPGIGSTFWFSAKLRPAAASIGAPTLPATDRPLLPPETLRGCRVLLAEDNPVNQEVALALLKNVGAHVEVASDGEEALTAATRSPFDIVLMDMQMPRMDGLEAARRIRRLPGGASVPIIAMTANAFTEDRQQCLAAGMNDHLSKPVDPEVLYGTMLRWYRAREHEVS
jgi:PAS domain S-box-containing protein